MRASIHPDPATRASAQTSPSASASARERKEAAPEASAKANVGVDAGWVKPAWAIPDPEPKRVDDIVETPADH